MVSDIFASKRYLKVEDSDAVMNISLLAKVNFNHLRYILVMQGCQGVGNFLRSYRLPEYCGCQLSTGVGRLHAIKGWSNSYMSHKALYK